MEVKTMSRQDATQTVPPAAISVRGVTKRFGDVVAVNDLSFDVHPGLVTGFLGPNGAGKSTTLRAILGLVAPTAGTATVLGERYEDLDEPARAVGAVLETQSFNPLRSGRNHLRVLAAASDIPDARVDEVLEQIGLAAAARRHAGTYSLGMRQRLALGAALLGDPRILILDEPTNGLDPQGIRWLRDLLRALAAEGRAILVSSHVLAEVAQIADEVVVIANGRLVRQGPLAELTDASHGVRVVTTEAPRLAARLRERGLRVVTEGSDEIHTFETDVAQVGMIAFELGVPVLGLESERGNLEDVFLELTEEDAR
jgi:ABC-2 type transport system ATP-binding protein